MGSTLDEKGQLRTRRILLVEQISGFHGPIGSNHIEDVTEDIEELVEALEKDTLTDKSKLGRVERRLNRLLEKVEFEDDA